MGTTGDTQECVNMAIEGDVEEKGNSLFKVAERNQKEEHYFLFVRLFSSVLFLKCNKWNSICKVSLGSRIDKEQERASHETNRRIKAYAGDRWALG